MKKVIICLFLILAFHVNYSQNVGIGTNTPAFKLDVAGRIRVKTGTLGVASTSSGIWMEDYRDGTNRVFIGMQDSIRAGFYGSGSGGVGWEFNFNAKTGYVGIGRDATTNRLELDDVNGASIGLYYNGNLGSRIAVTSTSTEITTRNGSTTCFPNPCPASDLILIPPLSGVGTATTGNVGIGLNSPGQKLSLNGAMGIYNGNTFIGSIGRNVNDLLINAKSGIALSSTLPGDLILQTYIDEDLTAGNVGIGTMNPSSKLEVNNEVDAIRGVSDEGTGVFASSNTGNALQVSGKIQINGNGQIPAAGKILTSDANGFATWQGAVAFAAQGFPGNASFLTIPPNTYVKVPFSSEEYDLSNNYSGAASPAHTFVAPVAGIYHFSTNLYFYSLYDYPDASLVLIRNGVSSTIARVQFGFEESGKAYYSIDRDVKLQAADQVFVQVYHTTDSDRFLYSENKNTWFTGRLVIRL